MANSSTLRHRPMTLTVPLVFFAAVAIFAAVIDLRTGRLPFPLSALMGAVAISDTFVRDGNTLHLITAGTTVAALCGAALFLTWLTWPGSIGFGDVTYVAPLGFILGTTRHDTNWWWAQGINDSVWMLLIAFAAAAAVAVIGRLRSIPLGPCLLTGCAVISTTGALRPL